MAFVSTILVGMIVGFVMIGLFLVIALASNAFVQGMGTVDTMVGFVRGLEQSTWMFYLRLLIAGIAHLFSFVILTDYYLRAKKQYPTLFGKVTG